MKNRGNFFVMLSISQAITYPAGRKLKNSVSRVVLASLLLLLCESATNAAEGPDIPSADTLMRLDIKESTSSETTSLIGERVDLNTGSISFSNIDVSIPGNSDLDVSFGRVYRTSQFRAGHRFDMGDWQIELPHIHSSTLYKPTMGLSSSSWAFGKACSGEIEQGMISSSDGTVTFLGHEVWNGDSLNVPGKTSDKLLANVTGAFSGGGETYTRITKGNWRISCKVHPGDFEPDNAWPSVDSWEGFVAESPEGVRYTFDKLYKVIGPFSEGKWGVIVEHLFMLVTRVEDRFGNWVNYRYEGKKLVEISSNDGRNISIGYNSDGVIGSVVANGQTWIYSYIRDSHNKLALSAVTRPDGKSWQYAMDALNYAGSVTNPYTLDRFCTPSGVPANGTVTIKHPDGLSASVSFNQVIHGRTEVQEIYNNLSKINYQPKCFSAIAVSRKELTGPGIAGSHVWSYSYSQNRGAYKGQQKPTVSGLSVPGYAAGDLKTTTVSGPDGSKTRHIFNRRWNYLDGSEVATEYYDVGGTRLLSRTEMQYANGGDVGGSSGMIYENGEPHAVRVNLTREITKTYVAGVQADTYTTEFSGFNTYGVPQQRKEYNSYSSNVRYVKSTYLHDPVQWLLNRPTKTEISSTGSSYVTESQTEYFPSASYGCSTCGSNWQPHYQWRFGGLVRTFESYHGNGEIFRVSLGLPERWQEFSNYKRGRPRTIAVPGRYPAEPPVTARIEVNDDGSVASIQDFDGAFTSLSYDSLGRVRLIDPADPAFSSTTVQYAVADAADVADAGGSVVGGQSKQVVTRGNSEKTSYFDALFRPVLVRQRDLTGAIESSYVKKAFNAYNKPLFVANTSASPAETRGVRNEYDGLQRLTKIVDTVDNSFDKIEFLAGNRKKLTNARGFETVTDFLAYGVPLQENPTRIENQATANLADSVVTAVAYNIFGNVVSIAQGGVTETRLYDAQQQLCKKIRPETGQSVFSYNAVGDLLWSVDGYAGSPSGCETTVTSQNKIEYFYDNRGDLKTEDFVNASTPDRTYKRDQKGRLLELTVGDYASYESRWSYGYNSQGLLEYERAQVDGFNWLVDYAYNENGQLNSLTYPGGSVVEFAPNAAGLPTKAGTYAVNAQYHPNGQLKSFYYGNGVHHETTLNDHFIPELLTASKSSVLNQLRYSYDDVGNISQIEDFVTPAWSKSFGYDGLDRLTVANGPWGAGSVSYDKLGNVTQKNLGSQSLVMVYGATSNRLESVSGSVVASFQYDDRGNTTNNGRNALSYNAAGQLTEVGGGNDADFYYDGHGRRIKDLVSGSNTYTLYSQSGQLLYKFVPQTNVKSTYVYLAGQLVARNDDSPSLPVTPSLTVPASVVTTGSYTVSWGAVSGATRYLLEEQIGSGSWILAQESSALSRSFSGKPDGTYSYRVKACNGTGDGNCSSFSTPASVVVLASPAVPSSISTPVGTDPDGLYVISWPATASATSYVLEEQVGAGGWTVVLNGNATSFSATRSNGTYNYRVKACNNSGASCSGYQTGTAFSVLLPPATPSLTSPSGTDPDGVFSVSWTAVATATLYTLEEQVNSGGWSVVYNSTGLSAGFSRGNGNYAYRIKACNSSGCSAYETDPAFTVLLPPLTPAALSTPTGTYTSATFTISWASSSTATSYQLEESANGGGWLGLYAGSAVSTSVTRGNGSYAYRVKACNASGCSDYNAQPVFTLLLSPATPSLTTPTGTDPDGVFSVSWTAVTTATLYTLEEQVNSGGWSVVYNSTGLSAGFSRGNGNYAYRIKACNSSGCSAYETDPAFTVLLPPLTPTTLSTPTGTYTSATFTISWASSSTATSYQLEESANSGGWLGFYTGSAVSTSVTRGNGSYAYRVRACNASGCSAYISQPAFTLLLPPGSPSLSTPSGTDGNGSFALNWSVPATTTATRLEESALGGGWTEIFNGAGSSFTVSGRTALGTYQYRARSCNGSGCSGYSATVAVNVVKPSVTASFSPNYLVGDAPSTLTWSSSNADRCELIETPDAGYNGALSGTSGSLNRIMTCNTSAVVRCYKESAFTEFMATITVKYGSCAGGV